MDTPKPPPPLMSTFWMSAWSLAMAMAWVLPNHYMPWPSYQAEIWTSGMVLLAATAVMLRGGARVHWHGAAQWVAVMAALPLLQFAWGLISLSGTAWISTAYLLGFLLTLLAGYQWEKTTPGQVADALFLSLGVAAILSVGLQLYQWLQLQSPDDIWIIKNSTGRPYGNLGQPNELGTLLVWGVIATGWGYMRKHLSGWTALGVSVYLLFGLAMTLSRTGWLSVAIITVGAWVWRKHWPHRNAALTVTGLAIGFVICALSMNALTQALRLDVSAEVLNLERTSSGKRPLIWAILLDAASQRPWLGYGWNQVVQAQLATAAQHPPLNEVTSHAHNLFLDLVLWCGIPMGLLLSGVWVRWLWQHVKAVSHAQTALLILLILVVFDHAMLELPLHHTFFLYPVGLVMGSLSAQQGGAVAKSAGRWSMGLVWLPSALLLGLFARDYSRLEDSYLAVRLEQARIHTETKASPPDVLVLSQWAAYIKMAQTVPTADAEPADIDEMRKVVETIAQPGQIYTLAQILASHGKPQEAQAWLQRLCTLIETDRCEALRAAWTAQPHLQILAPWPP